jgi:hypothetical protein
VEPDTTEGRSVEPCSGRLRFEIGLGCFVVLVRDDAELELPGRMLFEELRGRTPELPAQTVQGHPILLPLFSMRCSKCG